jgi:translocation protein SEC72
MDDAETFTLLPLAIDPSSKAISSTTTTRELQDELKTLNALHKTLLSLDTAVPGPPVPVNPQRSTQITKLRESGNAAFRKGSHPEALRLYSLGLQMALSRPPWEPSGLVRDEVAGLYANRAQTHMALGSWVEGASDAEASVEAKPIGNAKAWWRRGRCLLEMSREEEARQWVAKGLEVEGSETDLVGLLRDIEKRIEKLRTD